MKRTPAASHEQPHLVQSRTLPGRLRKGPTTSFPTDQGRGKGFSQRENGKRYAAFPGKGGNGGLTLKQLLPKQLLCYNLLNFSTALRIDLYSLIMGTILDSFSSIFWAISRT